MVRVGDRKYRALRISIWKKSTDKVEVCKSQQKKKRVMKHERVFLNMKMQILLFFNDVAKISCEMQICPDKNVAI